MSGPVACTLTELRLSYRKEDGAMAGKPIPDGFHTATPYLIVQAAEQAIAFYRATAPGPGIWQDPARGTPDR